MTESLPVVPTGTETTVEPITMVPIVPTGPETTVESTLEPKTTVEPIKSDPQYGSID